MDMIQRRSCAQVEPSKIRNEPGLIGRHNHVKATGYAPTIRAWLLYNVKFNGSKILLAHENDLCTDAFHQEQRRQHRRHFHISAKEKVVLLLSSGDAHRFKF